MKKIQQTNLEDSLGPSVASVSTNPQELLYCKMWGCGRAMSLEDSYKKQGNYCSETCHDMMQE